MGFLKRVEQSALQSNAITAPFGTAIDALNQGSTPHGQKAVVQNAASKYHISPETLWGVYGTETSFGKNVAVSSAGAVGPFQFLPSTARSLGINPNDFTSAANGAARYLKQLGADSNPDSPATAGALNRYSGGGGAGYIAKVRSNGKTFGSGLSQLASSAANSIPGVKQVEAVANDTSTFFNTILSPASLGQLAADAFAVTLRFAAKSVWKYALAPPWHRTQKAAVFYSTTALDGKRMGVNGDRYQWAIPATLAFWSIGFVALYGKADGTGATVSPRKTPLGRSFRAGQSVNARRKLIKAKDVKKKTPKKPKVKVSRVSILNPRTLSVSRRRAVNVTGIEGAQHADSTPPTPPTKIGLAAAPEKPDSAAEAKQTEGGTEAAANG